ncbi:MAG TPA: PilZ domain-containing protein [Cellvibrionaceae bacterium]
MSERREYFRMTMEARLELKQLEAEPAEGADPADEFPSQGMLKIVAELKRLDSDAAQLHPQIKDTDRALGEYLHLVSRKIDVLAQYCMATQSPPEGTIDSVILSEGGVNLFYPSALKEGQYLALHLNFSQPPMAIALYAKVSRCEPDRDKGYAIAAEFHYTSGLQRQQISQHMMRAQIDSIRRQPKN